MKNIIFVVLDSVRKDYFYHLFKNVSGELKEDFVNFSNCNSIYTFTFNAHYAIFFGDYIFSAKNNSFPSQLKKLGFNTRSFCNAAIISDYPLRNIIQENLEIRKPFRDEIIYDLGLKPEFNWKEEIIAINVKDYIGTADDEERNIPAKWKNFIIKNKKENNFLFLHFWNTHHNYKINEFLENKIDGMTCSDIGKELLKRIDKKLLTEKFVKEIYSKRIIEIINIYIKDLIKVLKDNGIYNNSLIFITGDHGEGLGDLGRNYPRKLYNIFHWFYIKYVFLKKKYSFLPEIKRINCKWDHCTFFHGEDYELQREVPLLVKFSNNEFGGINYINEVSFFDIIHTVNHIIDNKLVIKNNQGSSLYYLLTNGRDAREKYKIEKSIQSISF